jgi:hypothetical protein
MDKIGSSRKKPRGPDTIRLNRELLNPPKLRPALKHTNAATAEAEEADLVQVQVLQMETASLHCDNKLGANADKRGDNDLTDRPDLLSGNQQQIGLGELGARTNYSQDLINRK